MQLWKLPSISIAPEQLFSLFGFPITNTLLCTWIVIVILLFICYLGTRRQDLIPSGMQNAFEFLVEGLLGLVETVAGKKKGQNVSSMDVEISAMFSKAIFYRIRIEEMTGRAEGC